MSTSFGWLRSTTSKLYLRRVSPYPSLKVVSQSAPLQIGHKFCLDRCLTARALCVRVFVRARARMLVKKKLCKTNKRPPSKPQNRQTTQILIIYCQVRSTYSKSLVTLVTAGQRCQRSRAIDHSHTYLEKKRQEVLEK